jgi:hypothetical protein
MKGKEKKIMSREQMGKEEEEDKEDGVLAFGYRNTALVV